MSKFKFGQMVYCIQFGVGIVQSTNYSLVFPISVKIGAGAKLYTNEGKHHVTNLNPTLLTLEEARAKGYDVPKTKVVKEESMFMNMYSDGQKYIYKSKEDALKLSYNDHVLKAYPVTIKYEVEE